MALIWLADDHGPMRSDASRSVDPIGAGDRRFGADRWGRLTDDGRPIRSDASRPVDPVGASSGVALLSESERAHHNYDG